MTTAKSMGYKVGDKFRVVCPDDSEFIKGEIVVLIEDDGTRCPKFDRTGADNGEGYGYLYVDDDIVPLAKSGLMFEEKEVTTTVTFINAGRQLTQAEKDAIAKIIGG